MPDKVSPRNCAEQTGRGVAANNENPHLCRLLWVAALGGDTEQVLFWITRFLAEDSKQLSCRGLLNRCISPCWILQSPVGFWVYTWLCGKKYFAECPCTRGRLCMWDWKGLRTSLLGCQPNLQNSFTNPSLLFPWKQLGPLKSHS